tara:strand:- start:2373 stop:2843 length:471 start_codon:yes stop_codon:yes gene_type:complete
MKLILKSLLGLFKSKAKFIAPKVPNWTSVSVAPELNDEVIYVIHSGNWFSVAYYKKGRWVSCNNTPFKGAKAWIAIPKDFSKDIKSEWEWIPNTKHNKPIGGWNILTASKSGTFCIAHFMAKTYKHDPKWYMFEHAEREVYPTHYFELPEFDLHEA